MKTGIVSRFSKEIKEHDNTDQLKFKDGTVVVFEMNRRQRRVKAKQFIKSLRRTK